jgi:hypothetical protein
LGGVRETVERLRSMALKTPLPAPDHQ